MKKNEYDVLVVGGGIVGAGIFRDLALNNISTLLVEKGDFASQTSQWSSKMLHGGVRYLENFDFGLVQEALHEKNLWVKIAPHLCYESPFYLPVYKISKYPLWMMGVGLFIYDFLSNFKNSPFKILNKKRTLDNVKGLSAEGLRGAGIYHDAIVDDAKLTLENIYDGSLEDHCEALNYTEYLSYSKTNNKYEVKIKDTLTDQEKTITVKKIVFALGPFTDLVLSKSRENWKNKMLLSKGIHLWLRKEALPVKTPMLLPLQDGRVLFVIPQKDAILVGTTETDPESIENPTANEKDISYLKENILRFFPNDPIENDHIIATYAGIRPLVSESKHSKGKTSRFHKVFQLEEDIFSIAGGKLTTFRAMAQDVVKVIATNLNRDYNWDKTLSKLRQPSIIPPFKEKTKLNIKDIEKILKDEKVRTKEDFYLRRLGCFSLDHWPYKNSKDEVDRILNDFLSCH